MPPGSPACSLPYPVAWRLFPMFPSSRTPAFVTLLLEVTSCLLPPADPFLLSVSHLPTRLSSLISSKD